jgi:hypothetical protein
MNRKYRLTSFFLATIGFFLAIGIIFLPHRSIAQSDSAVRSELNSLRSRVSRLESEIRGASARRDYPSRNQSVPRSPSGTGVVNGQTVGRSDPMFERLSTLVIELKDQVNKLDKRVKTLEQETARRNR